ncbi:MAG TPA: xanthine dehydrogenase, partial [Candidatus Cloacimonadota bacterium]|nr:xanthine dehydrogenase [Candidatus Cloacimonadota bacterium]
MVKKNYKKTPPELNGTRHLQGLTRFIADEVKPSNMLYVTILHSTYAAANIKNISTHLAENMPGIFKIITAKDIPGENQIGHLMPDEPLLADNQVIYYGQPIALILSEDVRDAELAIPKIEVTYEVLNPILSIEEAIEAESFYIEERKIERGDWKTALQNAPHQLSGQVESGAQEH